MPSNPFAKAMGMNDDLPQWVDMGQQQTPDVSPFADMLKKRMSKGSTGGAGDAMGSLLGGGATAGKAAGGMKPESF